MNSPAGDLRRILRRIRPPVDVREADIARIREQYLGGLPDLLVQEIGSRLAEVELPARFAAHQFGLDDVIGVWRDEFDVEYVRVYPINK